MAHSVSPCCGLFYMASLSSSKTQHHRMILASEGTLILRCHAFYFYFFCMKRSIAFCGILVIQWQEPFSCVIIHIVSTNSLNGRVCKKACIFMIITLINIFNNIFRQPIAQAWQSLTRNFHSHFQNHRAWYGHFALIYSIWQALIRGLRGSPSICRQGTEYP